MVPPRQMFQPIFVIRTISPNDHFIPSFWFACSTNLLV